MNNWSNLSPLTVIYRCYKISVKNDFPALQDLRLKKIEHFPSIFFSELFGDIQLNVETKTYFFNIREYCENMVLQQKNEVFC